MCWQQLFGRFVADETAKNEVWPDIGPDVSLEPSKTTLAFHHASAMLSTAKRKREHQASPPNIHPNLRVSISDQLMPALRNDPTLQNALDSNAWRRLDELHAKHASGTLPVRGFVDGAGSIVGTMKLLGIVKHLSQELHTNPHHALRRVGSNSSTSSGGSSPGTPGGSEVQRILTQHRTRRPSPLRPQPDSAAPAPTPLRPSATPELTHEIALLLHAWHCNSDECNVPKCAMLKEQLERVEAHIGTRARPSSHEPASRPSVPCPITAKLHFWFPKADAPLFFFFVCVWQPCARRRWRSASAARCGSRSSAQAPAAPRAVRPPRQNDDAITRQQRPIIRQIL